jgi:hypothetical protein
MITAHTRFFGDQVAWLAAAWSKTTITALMRISWRTVGTIIARVAREAEAARDRFAGLGASASTRSPVSAAISTWSSWPTTTPGC